VLAPVMIATLPSSRPVITQMLPSRGLVSRPADMGDTF
jgi:hypothetical protein